MTSSSFPDIGEKVGGRDHSTVIYAHNKIKKAVESDRTLRDAIEDLQEKLIHKA
jgi:chromosomal replication initiator protein